MNSFYVLLTILFIGLKLTGYIFWSWFLVLLPMYIGVVVYLVVILSIGLYASYKVYKQNKVKSLYVR